MCHNIFLKTKPGFAWEPAMTNRDMMSLYTQFSYFLQGLKVMPSPPEQIAHSLPVPLMPKYGNCHDTADAILNKGKTQTDGKRLKTN